jgi:hypothetical protein
LSEFYRLRLKTVITSLRKNKTIQNYCAIAPLQANSLLASLPDFSPAQGLAWGLAIVARPRKARAGLPLILGPAMA